MLILKVLLILFILFTLFELVAPDRSRRFWDKVLGYEYKP